MILYAVVLNVWCHVHKQIASGVAVRGDSGVAGEGRVGVKSIWPCLSQELVEIDKKLWDVRSKGNVWNSWAWKVFDGQ